MDRRQEISYAFRIFAEPFFNDLFRCMMFKPLLLAAGVFLAPPVHADDVCLDRGCPTAVSFASASDSRSYGLLIAAPESGCARVRFRVQGAESFLGQTPPLAPGELAVVRLGRGFPEGRNEVQVAAVGCDRPPAATRQVVLAKLSPDHGWRAIRAMALR
ncbi:MAG TPA: hypothetical protein VK146_12825 [Tabrizicola sp.]|nr:hypothetical protein [Tabrizicola sp.]